MLVATANGTIEQYAVSLTKLSKGGYGMCPICGKRKATRFNRRIYALTCGKCDERYG